MLIDSRLTRHHRIKDSISDMRRKLFLDEHLVEVREEDEIREFGVRREPKDAYHQYLFCEEEIDKTKFRIKWVKKHLPESYKKLEE